MQGCHGDTGVVGGLGASPHWAHIQGPSTPTGRGVGGVRGLEGVRGALGCRELRGPAWVRGCQEALGPAGV